MKWIKIFSPGVFLRDNFIETVTISGKKICIVKTDDKIYAVQNKCPHAGADLSKGWCQAGNLVCPYHRHEFNLETGRGAPGQGDYLNKYPLEVRAEGVYLGIEKSWWKFWE